MGHHNHNNKFGATIWFKFSLAEDARNKEKVYMGVEDYVKCDSWFGRVKSVEHFGFKGFSATVAVSLHLFISLQFR